MVIKPSDPDLSMAKRAWGLIRPLFRKKVLFWLIGIDLAWACGLGLIYYGMVLHKTGQAEDLNDLVHNLRATRFGFAPNLIKGLMVNPEKISLDIGFEDFQRIVYFRKISLERGIILDDVKQEDIPATLTHNGQTYKVKLQMTGKFLDHLRHPKKWSFQVKMKGDHTLFGMREFMLLRPEIRGNLSEWICHQLERKEGLIVLTYDFIEVTINGDYVGIYAVEEHFDKYLVERNQLRDGILFKPGLHRIAVFNRGRIEKDPGFNAQLSLLEKLWGAFLVGDIPASRLFDIEKLATHYAIADLVNGHHEHYLGNTHYYFNPITGLVEPIGREWGSLRYSQDETTSLFMEDFGEFDGQYHQKVFSDPIFVAAYIKALDRLSKPEYLDRFFEQIKPDMETKLAIIYRANPVYAYPKHYLYRNQDLIRSKLYPKEMPLAAYSRGEREGKLLLALRQRNALPIEVVHVVADNGIVCEPVQPVILTAGDSSQRFRNQLAEFIVPAKGPQPDGFIDHLKLTYRILGTPVVENIDVFPWSDEEVSQSFPNFSRRPTNFRDHGFLLVDEASKRISIKSGDIRIDRDLIIPPGYRFVCRGGVRLDLANKAKVISYSPLEFRGSEEDPIIIQSSDSTGQGLAVLRAGGQSTMEHVMIRNLSNPTDFGWELTGAVTFYESPVRIFRCEFAENRSEDCLNIVRSDYTIDGSQFQQTLSDAFDADFSDGKIVNTRFRDCGNDAIDVSGSVLDIQDVFVDQAGDKGLSTGERSHVTVRHLEIRKAEIGLGTKDQTENNIEDLRMIDCHLGVTVYQKKSEFGPASVNVTRLEIVGSEIPYLVERGSALVIDGQQVPPSRENVKEILYGVEFGKASKQSNRPRPSL